MEEGETLNASHTEYPLYKATLYGSKVSTAKLSKRVSCAIKALPIRVIFHYEYDTLQALEKGVTKEPTMSLHNEILIEGLMQAEDITKVVESYLTKDIIPLKQ